MLYLSQITVDDLIPILIGSIAVGGCFALLLNELVTIIVEFFGVLFILPLIKLFKGNKKEKLD